RSDHAIRRGLRAVRPTLVLRRAHRDPAAAAAQPLTHTAGGRLQGMFRGGLGQHAARHASGGSPMSVAQKEIEREKAEPSVIIADAEERIAVGAERRPRRSTWWIPLLQVVMFAAIIGAWEYVSRYYVRELFLPAPSRIVVVILQQWSGIVQQT